MKKDETGQKLSMEQADQLMISLRSRFEKNMDRHRGIKWQDVSSRLELKAEKLWSLGKMEETGGEPDVTGLDSESGEYIFMDCSTESPAGRRNVCYDRQALDSRKNFKPENSARDMAAGMGIEILNEEQYRGLQMLGEFDTKTSSWIKTPEEIRKLGGALFADRRYGKVFIYHNSAPSYYGVRGFRGLIRV